MPHCKAFFCVLFVLVFGPFEIRGQERISPVEIKARQSELAAGDSFDVIAMRILMNGASNGVFEISDEQRREMSLLNSKLAQWYGDKYDELVTKHGGRQAVESNEELRAQVKADVENYVLKKWVETMQEDVLLPFQNGQLRAACVADVRKKLSDKALFSMPWIRKELEIDDTQLEEIKKRIDEESEKLEAETKRLMALLEQARANATKGVLEELSPAQREKAYELFPGFEPSEIAK